MSDTFGVANGVKQGGVLSPILFNVYLDYLLCMIKESGAGCYAGNVFTGALSHADDLILLSPTRQGMKVLINICEQFSIDFDTCFNALRVICYILETKQSKCVQIMWDRHRDCDS